MEFPCQIITYVFVFCLPILGGAIQIPESSLETDEFQTVVISESDLDNSERIVYITDLWKFKAGDNPEWAEPAIDDSDWQLVSTYLTEFDLAFMDWHGTGWFRFHFKVDTTLINRPIALLSESHNGASEVYLNGKKQFDMGYFSDDKELYRPYFDRRPRVIVFPEPGEYVLAVRYANFESDLFIDLKKYAGFRFLLGDPDYHLDNHYNSGDTNTLPLLFFLGSLLVFTAIHALIFGFNRGEMRNLYFSLFTLILSLLIVSQILMQYVDSPVNSIYLISLSQVLWILAILMSLRFVYSLFYVGTPLQFWFFSIFGLVIVILGWHNIQAISLLGELFILIVVLETMRVLYLIFTQREKGAWIIGTGMLFFALGILHRFSVNVELIEGDPVAGSVFGSGLMILSMSVFLSRDFALTQIKLGDKLREVQILSEKALEQEKLKKEIEIESKLLEAENKRKTNELEEARALQLSMLPRKMPQMEKIEIAVWMQTATEVGGDYYDYHISGNDTTTFVLGDATGHGLKAGIMVATAKSYFHTLAGEFDNLTILDKMSSGFRNLDLKLMFMGILLFRMDDRLATITSAGMPPVLWYRKSENCINTLVQKGLPLGSKIDFKYKSIDVHTQPEDIFVLMSDGLMELFNEQREQFGMQKIRQIVKEASNLKPDEIIRKLKTASEEWSGKSGNDDDITLMVIKVKQETHS